jgi:hypothetical protein
MQHELATGDRLVPARVGREVGRVDAEIGGVGHAADHRPHFALAPQVTHRGANLVTPAQQFDDAPASYEARTAGDQNRFPSHFGLPNISKRCLVDYFPNGKPSPGRAWAALDFTAPGPDNSPIGRRGRHSRNLDQ